MYITKLKKELENIFNSKDLKLVYSRYAEKSILSKYINPEDFIYNYVYYKQKQERIGGGCINLVLEDLSDFRDKENPYIFVTIQDFNLRATKYQSELKNLYFKKMYSLTKNNIYVDKEVLQNTVKEQTELFEKNVGNYFKDNHRFEIPDKFNTSIFSVKMRLKQKEENEKL